MRRLLTSIILIVALSLPGVARTALLTYGAPAIGPAQSPTTTPTPEATPTPTPDLVMEAAQREAKLADELKKKAVSDQERAEAEAARLKAIVQPLGSPANVSVPTGSVTTDAAGWIESQMLAKEAGRQITRKLTLSLCTQPITPPSSQATVSPVSSPTPATPGGANPRPAPRGLTFDKVKTLVIYSPGDLAGVELYGSIIGQLKRLENDLNTKNGEAKRFLDQTDPTIDTSAGVTDSPAALAFAAPGVATGVIKSVAELLNLFRTDTSFTNQAITLDENTIVSHIVHNFNTGVATGNKCEGTVRVYHPALYAPGLLESSENSAIIKRLNDVETAKVEAVGNVEKLDARIKQLKELSAAFKSRKDKSEELDGKKEERGNKVAALAKCRTSSKPAECRKKINAEIKALDNEIAQLEKDIKKLNADLKDVNADPKEFKGWIEKLSGLRDKTQGLITATNLISTKLNTPDETTKLTALAQLLRAERLHKIMSEPGTYTLRVEVKANGTTKVKKNLFVDAKVRHSAGADLTYQLIDRGGVIAQGQELKCYIEYQSAGNIQDMVSGTGKKRITCKFPDETTTSEAEQEQTASGQKPRRTDRGQ